MDRHDYGRIIVLGHDRFMFDGHEYHFYSGYHDAGGVGGWYECDHGNRLGYLKVEKEKLIGAQGHKIAALLFN